MEMILSKAKNAFVGVVVVVQIFAFPSVVFAQETSSTDTGASSGAATSSDEKQTGPIKPTGADGNTYKLNENTGNWENNYYSWNPKTKQTSPKTPQNYSYNPSTGMWDTTEYAYHPESGKYEPNVKSLAIALTGAGSNNSSSAQNPESNQISNSGPNSNNTIDHNGSSNGTFNLFFNNNISTIYDSKAKSGDASIQGNTRAGNALTGDASTLANVINLLQSSWLDQSSDVAGFVANVDGDVYGDLYVDPDAIPEGAGIANENVDLNISSNTAINNDIKLDSTSGNASVDGNTKAGSAKSGDVTAVANLMNMINSSISSGKSFLGILNIRGNLNGDILLPQSLLDSLIASTGPGSNNQITDNQSDRLDVSVDKSRTILNNVVATADSGTATISNNTKAGSARTGDAATNTSTMNLVGEKYKGKNGLLVFVNVLGKWIGLSIKPVTKNSVTNTGPNSNNTINSNNNRSVSVDADENSLINNNVSVSSKSGDASVTENTEAGDATTGDAYAAVNVLNMIDSEIDVSDWFGVLFINVFGTWEGSFGMNTAAGNNRTTATSAGGSSGNSSNKVFNFVPKGGVPSNNSSAGVGAMGASSSGTGGNAALAALLAAKPTSTSPINPAPATPAISSSSKGTPAWQKNLLLSTITALLAAAVLFGDRAANFARTRFASFL